MKVKSLLAAGTVAVSLGASVFFVTPKAQTIDWSNIISTNVANGADVTFDDIDGAKQVLLDSAADYLTNTSATGVTFDTWTLNINGTNYSNLAEAMGLEGNVSLSMYGDDLAGDPTEHLGANANNTIASLTSAVSGSQLADLFGVDIMLNINGPQVGFMTKTLQPIAFTANVPTNLPAVAEGATRTFHLVAQHGNEVKEIASSYNSATNKISGSTNEFSLFAVVYKDTTPTTSNTTTPATTPTTPTTDNKKKVMEEMSKEMEKVIASSTSTKTSVKKATTTKKVVKAPNTGAVK